MLDSCQEGQRPKTFNATIEYYGATGRLCFAVVDKITVAIINTGASHFCGNERGPGYYRISVFAILNTVNDLGEMINSAGKH
jgi:hypothetical protein